MEELLAGRGLGCWLRAAGDLPRPVLVGVAADAKLAEVIVTPAPQSAVGVGSAGEIVAGADVGPAARRRGGDLAG